MNEANYIILIVDKFYFYVKNNFMAKNNSVR